MADNDLDAIIALTNGPAWVTNAIPRAATATDDFANFVGSSTAAAASGYADITVPAGNPRSRSRSASRSSAAAGTSRT